MKSKKTNWFDLNLEKMDNISTYYPKPTVQIKFIPFLTRIIFTFICWYCRFVATGDPPFWKICITCIAYEHLNTPGALDSKVKSLTRFRSFVRFYSFLFIIIFRKNLVCTPFIKRVVEPSQKSPKGRGMKKCLMKGGIRNKVG